MEKHEFSFEATPELTKAAARSHFGFRAARQIIALLIAIGLLSIVAVDDLKGYAIFFIGFGTAKIVAWIVYYLRLVRPFQSLENQTINVLVDDEGLEIRYVDGFSKTFWTAPIKIRKCRRLWLISYLNARIYTFIPTDKLSEDLRVYIERKVRDNGGVIV